jgi:hypothetical protein
MNEDILILEIERKNSLLNELDEDDEEYLILSDELAKLEKTLYDLIQFESSANSSLSFV